MSAWQNINPSKSNYCVRISKCSNRNCDKKGNAEYAVISEDGKKYCSLDCTIDEKLEAAKHE